MKTRLVIMINCLFAIVQAYAQNGQLPPVHFSQEKNVCDTTPWKLVFHDDFNGETLQPPWITFISWNSMPGGDNDDWAQARSGGSNPVAPNSIHTDKNVVVSNGTCKIQMRKERSSWQCATCAMQPLNLDYTSGALCLPYSDKRFNAGKFEIRMKMPVFKYAHSTAWTWHGSGLWGIPGSSGVNEIDIAEAYGKNIAGLWGGFPRVNYSLHSWNPGNQGTPQNPYDMEHYEIRNRYPRQSWWNSMTGNGFRQDEFHIYVCEWDTAVIKFYVDGRLVGEHWKYYQGSKLNSSCAFAAGDWNITQGFPYNNASESQLRFTIGIDQTDESHENGLLGEMELDYVKIWQRHPEYGWKEIRNDSSR